MKHQKYRVQNFNGTVVKSFNKKSEAETYAHSNNLTLSISENTSEIRRDRRLSKRNSTLY